jgi:hypothetical protein
MYLHLGQNVVVPETAIIGIFDLDNTTSSHITRKFLFDAEKAGHVVNVSDELPNSFVVCGREDIAKCIFPPQTHNKDKTDNVESMTVYLSQLSSQTLFKRSVTMRII